MKCEESLIFMPGTIKSPNSNLKMSPKFCTQNNLTLPFHPQPPSPSFQLSSKIKESPIKFIGFKVKNTIMQIRARSNSPKMEDLPEIKNNNEMDNEDNKNSESIEKTEKAEVSRRITNFCKELQYLQKNELYNKKGFDICFQIFESLSSFENQSETLENLKKYLEKLVFAQDHRILKKVEISLNRNMFLLQHLLWRELVDELCEVKAEEKQTYLRKIQSMEKEKNKLNTYNNEVKEQESLNLEAVIKQGRIDLLQKENEILKEKIKNNEICLQKFSVENCKTKEEFQLQIELFTREKEGLQRSHEKAILDLNELLEKSKKESSEKETQILNLKFFHDRIKEDYKKMIKTMRNTKDKIFHLEERVSNLTTENEKLTIRAAASFEELTPRPSFQKFKEIFGFSDVLFENKTSREVADEIFKSCKNSFTKDQLDDLHTKARKSKPNNQIKNDCFTSIFSLKSANESGKPEDNISNNSLLINTSEIKGRSSELDEVLPREKPNMTLRVIIPDRIPKKHDKKKTGCSLSPCERKIKNGCAIHEKTQKKCQSP